LDIFVVSRLFDMSKTLYYKLLRINFREKPEGEINNGHTRETGSIGYTRHKTQDEGKQIKNTTQHALDTTMSKHTEIM
jgi:hypothetical protein